MHLGPLLLKSIEVWGWFYPKNFSRATFFVYWGTHLVDVFLNNIPMKQIWRNAQCEASEDFSRTYFKPVNITSTANTRMMFLYRRQHSCAVWTSNDVPSETPLDHAACKHIGIHEESIMWLSLDFWFTDSTLVTNSFTVIFQLLITIIDLLFFPISVGLECAGLIFLHACSLVWAYSFLKNQRA